MSNARKSIIKGMGQAARQRRLDRLRQKYGTGNASLDEVAASQDAAVDAAQMPEMKKQPLIEGMGEVNSMADAMADENKAALAGFDDDDELARYLASK